MISRIVLSLIWASTLTQLLASGDYWRALLVVVVGDVVLRLVEHRRTFR